MTSIPARCNALDHGAKLIEAGDGVIGVGAISKVWSEKRNGIITPVVGQPRRGVRRVELVDRQQFDGCDAKRLKIRNLLNNAQIGSSVSNGDARRWVACKAGDMQFIDDRIPEETVDWLVVLPIEKRQICNHTLH
jgi:hypothetical protein